MTHATSIKGFASLQDAAEEIGRMRYDALAEFLWHLMNEMQTQQMKDRNAKKLQLVDDTYPLIHALSDASAAADTMFDKYKHFMKDEIDE